MSAPKVIRGAPQRVAILHQPHERRNELAELLVADTLIHGRCLHLDMGGENGGVEDREAELMHVDDHAARLGCTRPAYTPSGEIAAPGATGRT